MRGFGGLVTFLVRDADWRATARIVDSVRIPRIAPSLGGVESLVSIPCLTSHAMLSREEREQAGIRDSLVRLALGIEDAEDLIADIDNALAGLG